MGVENKDNLFQDNQRLFLSVIVPVYNVAKYLPRCMQSIIDQDFSSYEVILVDDGSTDGSSFLCDEYGKHEKVKVVHKSNGGLASARNAGLNIANGEYIIFVDSDDWISQSSFRSIYHAVESSPLFDIIKYNYIRHTDKQTNCKSYVSQGIYEGNKVSELIHYACQNAGGYCLSAWSHAYRRTFLQHNQLCFISEREVGSEDYLFNLEALLYAKSVCVTDTYIYHYDMRDGSLTQKYRKNLADQYTKLYNVLCNYYESNGKLHLYQKDLAWFYIWSLIYGTGFVNEYTQTSNHSLIDGRKQIRKNLTILEVKAAIQLCVKQCSNRKKKILLYAMKYKFEPLFYWLFVVKPKRKGN